MPRDEGNRGENPADEGMREKFPQRLRGRPAKKRTEDGAYERLRKSVKQRKSGAPSRRSGGTTSIRRMCWIMWTVRDASSKAESGEPMATQSRNMAARKAARRRIESSPGEVRSKGKPAAQIKNRDK